MRTAGYLVTRGIFWIGALVIVGYSCLQSYAWGEPFTIILKLVFFPFTYVLTPWFNGLWFVFLLSIGGYALSNVFIFNPVD